MQVIELGTATAAGVVGPVALPLNDPNAVWTILGVGTPGSGLSWKCQVSPDGNSWLDEGSTFTTPQKATSSTKAPFVRVNVTAGTGMNMRFFICV